MLKNTIANTSADTEKAILTIDWVVNCQLEGNIALRYLYGGFSYVVRPVNQTAPGAILYSIKP